MKRKLLLHVGSHKTGSTSLQRYLYENQDTLRDHGWSLFFSKNKKNSSSYTSVGSSNSWVTLSGVKSKFTAQLSPSIIQEVLKLDGNVIISAEELSWVFLIEDIQKIKDLFEPYFSVHVLFYIRRQDKFLLSHYQQGFKTKESSAASFYGRELTPSPEFCEYFDMYLDYFKKVNDWVSVFSIDNVSVRWFDVKSLIGSNIIDDFFDFIDVIPVREHASINQSLSRYEMVANYHIFDNDILNYSVRKQLSKNFLNDGNKFLPSKSQMQFILNRYHINNIALSKQFDIELPYDLENIDWGEFPDQESSLSVADYREVLSGTLKAFGDMSISDLLKFFMKFVFYKVFRN